MANGTIITQEHLKNVVNSVHTGTNDPQSYMKVGVGTTQPTQTDTDLADAVPISDGTVLDNGSNTLTGSSGGDNTTDNTTTFKPGAGETDDTAQNLIANSSNATKIWTDTTLATNATADQLTGLWIYVLDQTTLDKFLSSGTALEVKIGSDASNYYSQTYTASSLSLGWNWLSLGQLDQLTETGTVGSPIDTFIIEITTNNATDTFAAGDVIYDLLRQWEESDTQKSIEGTAVTEAEFKAVVTTELTTTEANGFALTTDALFTTADNMSAAGLHDTESKSNSEIFEYRYTFRYRERGG